MVFTAFQARRLNPEEVNPMAGAVSKALEGFGQGMKAAYMPANMKQDLLKKEILNKYLPQMQEAEIFGKQFSPLAILATTPMFLQNPQFQKMLGQLIAQNPGMAGLQGGGQTGQGTVNAAPTYAEQANLDIAAAQKLADDITKQGKIKGFISSAGGGIKSYGGDLGNMLIGHLPKKIQELLNPQLAANIHKFETYLTGLKNRAIQTHVMTADQANKEFAEHEDENASQRLDRIRRIAPSIFQQSAAEQPGGVVPEEQSATEPMPAAEEGTITPEQEQNDSDNRDLSFAADLSEKIKKKTGHDVSPDLIFNYMKRVPGKISIPLLLKAAGVR